jgi:glycosyltransferase involved in cell wall biosynthesis
MVGPGGPLAGQVGRKAAHLGVADMIHIVGWVADMPALMAGAELLVCPSLHEGFALTVVEAMAVGTSVVASKRGALPETLGEAGLLVEPSVDDLTGALVRAGSDSELRVRLSDQGIVRAREFSWRRAAKETAAVYRSVGDRNWT